MNEIFEKLPEVIKSLLARISQSNTDNPNIIAAQKKLVSQLNGIMDEISFLQGNEINEEQVKKIEELPKILLPSMQWNIKPRKSEDNGTE